MEKLNMCRICLATDIRMNSILNTHLQDVYEKLTLKQFETKDSRPTQACYLCYARLQNCYQLSMNCLRSEGLLTQMLSGKMTKPTNLHEVPRHMRLGTTPVIVETVEDLLYDVDRQVLVDSSSSSAMKTKVVVNGVVGDGVPQMRIKKEPGLDDTLQNDDFKYEVPLHIVKHEFDISGIPTLEDKEPAQQTKVQNMGDPKPVKQKSSEVTTIQPLNGKVKLKKCVKTKTANAHVNKPYTCTYCPKDFARKAHLTRHMYSHTGERPVRCNLCEKSFTSKSSLTHHTVQNHTHKKPFPCNKCDEGFMVKIRLNKHIVSKHIDWDKCVCEYCSEVYTTKTDLENHVRTDHGDKPFKCDLCGNCYARNCDLLRHYPTHSNKKEYKCELCPKSYTKRRYYLIHYRLHTGEKPYQCDMCEKKFRAKSHVVKHIRGHMRLV